MTIFHILTIFPEIFKNNSYFDYSILKRAQEKKLLQIIAHNIRDYTEDKHRTVDDIPYGGGPGMVMKVEPIYKTITEIKKSLHPKPSTLNAHIILFSPRGKKLDGKIAQRLARYKNILMICGRYEGVDERVAQHIADEEISIGDYVLSGGELPAMVVIEAISRYIPGVLGKQESLESIKGSYPAYTRPEIFKIQSPKSRTKNPEWKVPKILLSGNHKKIDAWRHSKEKTPKPQKK